MLKKLCLILALALAVALPAAAQNRSSSGILMASAAQTATVTSETMDATTYKGVHVIINVTAYTSGTWTPKIQGRDPVSGSWYDVLVGTAINATGMTVLKVYPGIATSANAAAADILPNTWRVTMVGATTPIATFSVAYYAEY